MPIEVEKVLNDLYPLLRTVQPAELNYTLNAIATALEGRGDKLGESLVTLDAYLERLNPQIPAADRGPRLSETSPPSTPTVTPRTAPHPAQHGHDRQHPRGPRDKLKTLFDDVTAFSDTTQTS